MSASALSDESLLRFYDSVGEKVEADRDLRRRGHTHFFANGDGVKKYAAGLRAEMERRRLSFSPINWLWAGMRVSGHRPDRAQALVSSGRR